MYDTEQSVSGAGLSRPQFNTAVLFQFPAQAISQSRGVFIPYRIFQIQRCLPQSGLDAFQAGVHLFVPQPHILRQRQKMQCQIRGEKGAHIFHKAVQYPHPAAAEIFHRTEFQKINGVFAAGVRACDDKARGSAVRIVFYQAAQTPAFGIKEILCLSQSVLSASGRAEGHHRKLQAAVPGQLHPQGPETAGPRRQAACW